MRTQTGQVWKKYPPANAEYDPSYRCPACQIYIVDYSQTIPKVKAKELAQSGEG